MSSIREISPLRRGYSAPGGREISSIENPVSNISPEADQSSVLGPPTPSVAILTGGGDRPYALGLANSLLAARVAFDFIGSDELESRELRQNPLVRFLNLRGDQRGDVGFGRKSGVSSCTTVDW